MLGQFEQKFRVADLVKCITEVKQNKVYLLTLYEFSAQVFNKLDQLRFALSPFPETMLKIIENVMLIEVLCEL